MIWAIALAFLAIFLHAQVVGFRQLADLSTLSADNGMRLQEVRDLAAGQSWFDTRVARYLPPDGTRMHWSRLVDAPLAGALLALSPALGPELAERVVLAACPLLLLAIYGALAIVILRRSFGGRAAAFSIIVAVNLLAFRDLFAVGEIDHHNVEVVLTLASVVFFAVASASPIAALGGGLASALSLAVALESLPFVAALGFAYAVTWLGDAKQWRAFLYFGAALALGSFTTFVAQTPRGLWLVPACDTLSPPWLLLAIGGGAASVVMTALGALFRSWPARLALLAIFGAALAGAFVVAYPGCLAGPYQAVPESVRAAWLESTGEALSLREAFSRYPVLVTTVFGPAVAAAIAAWVGAFKSRGGGQRLLFVSAILLSLTLLLSLIEIRVIYIGSAVIPLAAGWALSRILMQATAPGTRLATALALVIAGSLFFAPPWVSVAAMADRFHLVSPAAAHDAGQMHQCLREVPKLRDVPEGTILGPLDLGAHILFLTDQSIVSAGYHRNVEGIVAGIAAFAGTEADMQNFVMRDHADYVALCLPWIEAYPDRYGAFAKALGRGEVTSSWLTPVPLETRTLKLWRVTPG